jgi:hypothetical protein
VNNGHTLRYPKDTHVEKTADAGPEYEKSGDDHCMTVIYISRTMSMIMRPPKGGSQYKIFRNLL